MSPFLAFELLFFAVFGQTTPGSLKTNSENQPDWTLVLFKVTGGKSKNLHFVSTSTVISFSVLLNPVTSFELLFFAVFGQTTADGLKSKHTKQPGWTLILYKLVFGKSPEDGFSFFLRRAECGIFRSCACAKMVF